MGSGVAKVLFEKYPRVKSVYHIYMNEMSDDMMNWRDEDFLGTYHKVSAMGSMKHNILNCFTQLEYGYDGKKYISYDAIYEIFKDLTISTNIKELAIPIIGCGLAGGNWEIVSRIIDDATGDDLDVYVYYLED